MELIAKVHSPLIIITEVQGSVLCLQTSRDLKGAQYIYMKKSPFTVLH